MERNLYLRTVPIAEAVETLKGALDRTALLTSVRVPTQTALGKVTASPVFAKASSPTFHSAAMDGIAVRSADTFGAREGEPLVLQKNAGYVQVNTGNALPSGFDAVIMAEHVVPAGDPKDEQVAIEAPAFPYQHVRRIGEDIVATELIIPRNRRLTPYDLGALLTGGIFDVEVWETPRVAVIPTGDEVLNYENRPEPKAGEVIESNSAMLCAMVASWGFQARRVAPVADDLEALTKAARAALQSDAHAVVIGAGSSAGTKDYTRKVMERLGTVLIHGVSAMPGKPTLLGVASSELGGKLLMGAPGYPVSAAVSFEEMLKPLLCWLTRIIPQRRQSVTAELTRKLPSKLGIEEYVRLAVGRVRDRWVATPLTRGAGMITSLTKAQAICRVPEQVEGLESGAEVQAELLASLEDLERTVVVVGSHDNTLDLLADMLMGLDEPVRMASTHVGSMGGIAALTGGRALCAGTHLFDPETGDFNSSFIAKHAPGLDVTLINLAIRHQGLMVAPGNPKNIGGVQDLARQDVRFINRQRGAGTRILLDYHLSQAAIAPSQVAGYDKEEFTHMAVAVNVLTGIADCGLGIFAAAKALGLDFIELARERYDLAIPTEFLTDPRIVAMLTVIRSSDFQKQVAALGGYETALTGQVMRPGQGLGS